MENPVLNGKNYIAERMRIKNPDPFKFPKLCVLGFFPSLYRYLEQHYSVQKVDFINRRHPYFLFSRNGHPIAFQTPGMGAPCAGAQLEEAIALGADKILFFGTCGLLDPQVRSDHLILLTEAVIDEGTSKHYENLSNTSRPDAGLTASLKTILLGNHIPFIQSKTWTTDAVYRETPGKINSMRQNGCVCVDMESSALFSISSFHQKQIAGYLIPGDRLTEKTWQPADERLFIKPSRLLELAMDALVVNASSGLSYS